MASPRSLSWYAGNETQLLSFQSPCSINSIVPLHVKNKAYFIFSAAHRNASSFLYAFYSSRILFLFQRTEPNSTTHCFTGGLLSPTAAHTPIILGFLLQTLGDLYGRKTSTWRNLCCLFLVEYYFCEDAFTFSLTLHIMPLK